MKNLFYFLFFISFYVNSAEKKEKTLKIQTSDEFIIEAPEKYFLTSCVVQELLKDCSDEDNPIPLFNISYKDWLEVEPFLHAISILEDKNSLNTARIKANNEFLQLNSQEKIYPILCIANYLQIPVLLEKCMQAWGEKNYSSTDNFFLPSELSLAIAQYMPRFKALKDATASWIVSEFNNKKEMLCVDNYEPHLNSVWCVDFSKCGKYLAAGHGRGAISCIDLEKNDGISLPSGHPRVSLYRV